jgi:hypothetical protein
MTLIATRAAAVSVAFIILIAVSLAQTTPSPGPTNPTQPNPQSKPGATMVINPTDEECKRGWNAALKWTKEQFKEFCGRLGTSK